MRPAAGSVPAAEDWFLFGMLELALLCLVLFVGIVVLVFFPSDKTLRRVSPKNRLMAPGLVWLTLIPLFNLVWLFFVATCIPDSLRSECKGQGHDDGTDYGKRIGLTCAILGLASIPLGLMAMRLIACLVLLGSLTQFILFWHEIAGYGAQLAASAERDADQLKC
jgi:hypothetical protein